MVDLGGLSSLRRSFPRVRHVLGFPVYRFRPAPGRRSTPRSGSALLYTRSVGIYPFDLQRIYAAADFPPDRGIEADDLGHVGALELRPESTLRSGRVPHAEQQRGRSENSETGRWRSGESRRSSRARCRTGETTSRRAGYPGRWRRRAGEAPRAPSASRSRSRPRRPRSPRRARGSPALPISHPSRRASSARFA